MAPWLGNVTWLCCVITWDSISDVSMSAASHRDDEKRGLGSGRTQQDTSTSANGGCQGIQGSRYFSFHSGRKTEQNPEKQFHQTYSEGCLSPIDGVVSVEEYMGCCGRNRQTWLDNCSCYRVSICILCHLLVSLMHQVYIKILCRHQPLPDRSPFTSFQKTSITVSSGQLEQAS